METHAYLGTYAAGTYGYLNTPSSFLPGTKLKFGPREQNDCNLLIIIHVCINMKIGYKLCIDNAMLFSNVQQCMFFQIGTLLSDALCYC